MSGKIMRRSSVFNYFEIVKRTKKFFDENHLVGTALSVFIILFFKWLWKPEQMTLQAFISTGIIMVGLSLVKYNHDREIKKQDFVEMVEEARIAKEIVDTHKQHETIDLLLETGYYSARTLIQHTLRYIDDGDEIDMPLLKMLSKSARSAQQMLGDKLTLPFLPHREFYIKYFGGDKEKADEPDLSKIPLTDALNISRTEIISTADVNEKTKDLQDMNKPTVET